MKVYLRAAGGEIPAETALSGGKIELHMEDGGVIVGWNGALLDEAGGAVTMQEIAGRLGENAPAGIARRIVALEETLRRIGKELGI